MIWQASPTTQVYTANTLFNPGDQVPNVSAVEVPELNAPDIRVFPNPGNGTVTVLFGEHLPENGELTYRIYNAWGQILQSGNILPGAAIQTELPDGMYWLMLEWADQQVGKKIVVHR